MIISHSKWYNHKYQKKQLTDDNDNQRSEYDFKQSDTKSYIREEDEQK
jgi:hypothetical protein